MENRIVGHQLYGNGDSKVIVLHSWMGDAQTWKTIVPFLNPDQYTYVFMDVRGYGDSKEFLGSYNIEEIKNDIFSLAKALEFSKFHLIGHSMSGMAAQYTALHDKDDRIDKVVLITPVSAAGFRADEESKSFFASIIQNIEVAKMGYNAFTSNRYSDYWYSKRARRHVQVTDEKAQLAYMNMWLEEDFLQQMTTVEKPFLVVACCYDHPQFRIEFQKENFRSFRKVDFIECENSGHFPMQEAPVFLASEIEKYLS